MRILYILLSFSSECHYKLLHLQARSAAAVDPFIILCVCHHDPFINMIKRRLISDTDARAYLSCISAKNKLGFSQTHLALTTETNLRTIR